jgi:signal transduction histidine kinase
VSHDNPDSSDALARLHALAAVGELAAGVAHETRNLLTGILGFAQVAKERTGEPAFGDVERIERDALRCLELLDRFLRLSRVTEELEPIDIREVVDHVAAATSHTLALKRIALRTAPVGDLPVIHGRRGELQQVLLNLVMNAMHATPSGGEISIATSARSGVVEISVVDTGIGIPAELRQRIFEPFFTTRTDGTGLGLALCCSMIERNGGSLTLDPAHAPGARFVVHLPVRGTT